MALKRIRIIQYNWSFRLVTYSRSAQIQLVLTPYTEFTIRINPGTADELALEAVRTGSHKLAMMAQTFQNRLYFER